VSRLTPTFSLHYLYCACHGHTVIHFLKRAQQHAISESCNVHTITQCAHDNPHTEAYKVEKLLRNISNTKVYKTYLNS